MTNETVTATARNPDALDPDLRTDEGALVQPLEIKEGETVVTERIGIAGGSPVLDLNPVIVIAGGGVQGRLDGPVDPDRQEHLRPDEAGRRRRLLLLRRGMPELFSACS